MLNALLESRRVLTSAALHVAPKFSKPEKPPLMSSCLDLLAWNTWLGSEVCSECDRAALNSGSNAAFWNKTS